MDDDVDEARLQLRQALSHCAQDREELDRLRKMLQQEREVAQRREKEIEELQASNAEELAKLNETLRKAEQVKNPPARAALHVYPWPSFLLVLTPCRNFLSRSLVQARRDGEIQLHPLEQREAELAEELHRQKEKERLRKEYIEELKKRHEEEKNRLEALHLKEQAGRRDDQVRSYVIHDVWLCLRKVFAFFHSNFDKRAPQKITGVIVVFCQVLRLTAETALTKVQAELRWSSSKSASVTRNQHAHGCKYSRFHRMLLIFVVNNL
jgi:hypothetical protein